MYATDWKVVPMSLSKKPKGNNMLKLHAIMNGRVIYTSSTGKIIAETITQDAKAVLDWYVHNVPANQE